jgi:ubiquinone/menaquinone biosynthesis C-methylase UbiE
MPETCRDAQRKAFRRNESHYTHPMPNPESHWNQLHENPRFRPSYPNDHVVRFLMASRGLLEKSNPARFLDIGVGAGRHTKLASELAFETYGIDLSLTGLKHARQRLQMAGVQHCLAQASMLRLPFADNRFDVVLSFGVFYYATAAEMKQAISEAHRILPRGGRLLVVLRTTQDYRFGKGEKLEPNTFRLTIEDTNEAGTVQHFVTAEDLPVYFAAFSQMSFEKTETTFAERTRLDSDWVITAEK